MVEKADKHYNADLLQASLPRLARQSVQDVLAEVGRNEMPPLNVILAIYPDYKTDETETLDATASGFDQTPDSDRIPIRGINSDLPVRFSKDGGAVPGDNIVGWLS